MTAALAETDFDDGDGSGPFDPRDFAIAALEHQVAEFRRIMRRLLDSEGEEAGEAIEEAERLLDGLDTIDAEDESEREIEAHRLSPTCDTCGTWKGVGTSYCPECDADALKRLAERQAEPPPNVTYLHCPF